MVTARKKPTYADIEALPEGVNGEILNGELVVSPRPASRHAIASSRLLTSVAGAFGMGPGGSGPGGWHILHEVELSLGVDERFDPVIPDIAGWRTERVPEFPDVPRVAITPDWVCEVLSPSTAKIDRAQKLPFYARAGVKHAWFVDALATTLEVFRLENGRWSLLNVFTGDTVFRAEPFEAIELNLAPLWSSR